MAEYYPLLAKAVAGIPNSTPELRRAVYERARKALLAQLTSLDPPIPESDIARETGALDAAVERLEAELASSESKAAASTVVADDPSKGVGAKADAPQPQPRPARPPAPVAGGAASRPVLPGRAKSFEIKPSAPSFAASAKLQASAPPRVAPNMANATPPRHTGLEAAAQNAGTIKAPEPPQDKASGAKEPEERSAPGVEEDALGSDFEATGAQAPRSRADGPRIYVPQPGAAEDARTSFRLWLVGGIVALVVAVVAIAAWSLRDRPGEVAKLKPAAATQTKAEGKIVARVGGPKPPENASAVPPAPPPASPAVAPTTGGAAPASTAAPNTATAPAAASPAAKPQGAGQTIAVTHRAALLVAVPGEQNKAKTYVGTVVWRLDNVSAGPGQPLGTAVHADIDVPEDKLKVSLTLQKNTDPSLDVSHTMTVVFTVQPDSPTGGIKQINAPQLRADDTPYGQPLAGVPVPIMENSFLIGLNRGGSEKTNLDLIKQRAWFDIPILLNNGSIAKLTFEKGVSGTRVIDEAIAAWQGQGQ